MQISKDRVASLFIMAAMAVVWMQTANIPPEPRFFPRAIILFAGALAAIMFAKTFLKHTASREQPFFTNGPSFLIIIAMTIGLIWLITLIGFFTASALFMIVFAFVSGYRNTLATFMATMIFMGGLYLIFIWLLQRPLPRELLSSLL